MQDPIVSAEELNHDLDLINKWAYQWKMSFNPDPSKPAEEILFSCKRKKTDHPPIFFNNLEVKRVNDHKHLGLILDSKLSFAKHISEKVSTARKGIGVIKDLAPYLPLKSRDQIFKMHVRPHLDYCDIIYHIPVKTRITDDFHTTFSSNHQMDILERTQYQAALAVSGAWKGTSREKIYLQLGWESLENRRIFRRIIQFYKIISGLTPDYLRTPIPSLRGHLFGYRITNIFNTVFCRTDRYQNSFFPDSVTLWNELGPTLRGVVSLKILKCNLLKFYRPIKKNIFDIHNPGIKWIFQLRVGLSPLKSHKFKHNFRDTPVNTCQCTRVEETTFHFLLKCPIYEMQRRNLFLIITPILLANNMYNVSETYLESLLLYGDKKFKFSENQNILQSTISFINSTSRFSRT